MKKIIALLSAVTLIAIGVMILPLPIPLGVVLILSGICLAIMASPWVKRSVLHFRHTHPEVERVIDRVKHYLPRLLRQPIDDSDPDENNST